MHPRYTCTVHTAGLFIWKNQREIILQFCTVEPPKLEFNEVLSPLNRILYVSLRSSSPVPSTALSESLCKVMRGDGRDCSSQWSRRVVACISICQVIMSYDVQPYLFFPPQDMDYNIPSTFSPSKGKPRDAFPTFSAFLPNPIPFLLF